MSIPRFFVDGISRIDPDRRTGIVRLTFDVKDGNSTEETVQLLIHVDSLNQAFQRVGETMQSTFSKGGGPGRGRPPEPQKSGFRDLTED
jgi:hypothetical protein